MVILWSSDHERVVCILFYKDIKYKYSNLTHSVSCVFFCICSMLFWNFSWVFNSSAGLLVSLMSFLSMCPSIHFPCLCQLTAVNDKMAEYTNTPGTASLNAALMHTLQRHRDILQVCPLIHVNFPPLFFLLICFL